MTGWADRNRPQPLTIVGARVRHGGVASAAEHLLDGHIGEKLLWAQRLASYLVSFERTKRFAVAAITKHRLDTLGAQARETFETQVESARKPRKLVEQMVAPVGRLLKDDASQKALLELKDLSTATINRLRNQQITSSQRRAWRADPTTSSLVLRPGPSGPGPHSMMGGQIIRVETT
jgi:hypothetical protein